jgi:N-carbamoylputrescine amidase
MQNMRVALVQLAWSGSIESMQEQYRRLIKEAAAKGAQLVCLPEFSLIPYFPGTTDPTGFAWGEALPNGVSERFFSEMAREHGVALIGSLFEKAENGEYWDTAMLHAPDGTLTGITRKVHIPSGTGYNETTFFGGWHEYPIHNVGDLKLAMPTCYDQWFPEMARICALNGAEYIFYPTAIGSEPEAPAVDTQEAWQTVMRGHAIANGVYIGAANRVGIENGVVFYGSSFICNPMGRIIAQAGRDTTEVITADLDATLFAHWRSLFPLLQQRQPQKYGRISEV